jgi:hypothetical protein
MPRDRSTGPSPLGAPRVKPASLSVWFFVRIFLLGCVAVIASFWGLVRFYTRVHPPMVVPVVPTAVESGALDAGSGGTEVIPAPEIEVEGR